MVYNSKYCTIIYIIYYCVRHVFDDFCAAAGSQLHMFIEQFAKFVIAIFRISLFTNMCVSICGVGMQAYIRNIQIYFIVKNIIT